MNTVISAKQCIEQQTLFLIRIKKQDDWQARYRKEPLGCIIKIDLRPYGWKDLAYTYDSDVYREATGLEKIFVMSGQRDVIIERNK
jgi:hypothetical protein